MIPDNWTSECIHPAKIAGGIPRSLHCHGADGCQPVPGDQHGSGSWKNVILALSDAMRYQASTFSRNHSQSKLI